MCDIRNPPAWNLIIDFINLLCFLRQTPIFSLTEQKPLHMISRKTCHSGNDGYKSPIKVPNGFQIFGMPLFWKAGKPYPYVHCWHGFQMWIKAKSTRYDKPIHTTPKPRAFFHDTGSIWGLEILGWNYLIQGWITTTYVRGDFQDFKTHCWIYSIECHKQINLQIDLLATK